MRVVLPAPLAPRSPTTSPARSSRSTPATAVNEPKRRTRRSATASGREPGSPPRLAPPRGAPLRRRCACPRRGVQDGRVRERARVAILEQDDAGGALGLVEVGGGHENRGPGRGRPGDEPPQVGAAHGVDAGRRLVEHEQVGLVEHGEREGELLAHAAGEPPGEAGARAGEPDAGEQVRRALLAIARAETVGVGDEGDVLVDAEVAVDAGGAGDVADPAAVRPAHAAGRGTRHTGERAQQRRLAGAVAADHGGHGASRHLERHAVERRARPVANGQVAHAPRARRGRDAAHGVAAVTATRLTTPLTGPLRCPRRPAPAPAPPAPRPAPGRGGSAGWRR